MHTVCRCIHTCYVCTLFVCTGLDGVRVTYVQCIYVRMYSTTIFDSTRSAIYSMYTYVQSDMIMFYNVQ